MYHLCKKNSRNALEIQLNFDKDTETNMLMGKYILSDNKNEKNLIKNKIFETEKLYNQNTNGGEVEKRKF